jgi:hypothetical protein
MRRRPPTLSAGGQRLEVHPPPSGRYYYDVTGKQAALAAAEAFSYGANAMIRTDAAGLKPWRRCWIFCARFRRAVPPVADIGYIDDGSGHPASDESSGSEQFAVSSGVGARQAPEVECETRRQRNPLADAKNPGTVAHSVRSNLTDENARCESMAAR